MPDYVMMFKTDSGERMNAERWITILHRYGTHVDYNPEQIASKHFRFCTSTAVADQIRTDHPELTIELQVSYSSGPAPIDYKSIKDQLK